MCLVITAKPSMAQRDTYALYNEQYLETSRLQRNYLAVEDSSEFSKRRSTQVNVVMK